jgi:hypothetical protein
LFKFIVNNLDIFDIYLLSNSFHLYEEKKLFDFLYILYITRDIESYNFVSSIIKFVVL